MPQVFIYIHHLLHYPCLGNLCLHSGGPLRRKGLSNFWGNGSLSLEFVLPLYMGKCTLPNRYSLPALSIGRKCGRKGTSQKTCRLILRAGDSHHHEDPQEVKEEEHLSVLVRALSVKQTNRR